MKAYAILIGGMMAFPFGAQIPPIPVGQINTTTSPATGISIGQVVKVTCRMSGYHGTAEIDFVSFFVLYDPSRLAFVNGSFSTGTASGPEEQWLSNAPQESAAEGYSLMNQSHGVFPGSVWIQLGDLERTRVERGTKATNGFLISFQLQAVGHGSTSLTLEPHGPVLFDNAVQPVGTVIFSAPPLVVISNPVSIFVEVADGHGSEPGEDTAAFRMRREGPTNGPVTVRYSVGGTARLWYDYGRIAKGYIDDAVEIPAGVTNEFLAVAPADDAVPEEDETVTITLMPSPSYEIRGPPTATIVIHDGDDPETLKPPRPRTAEENQQAGERLRRNWETILGLKDFEQEERKHYLVAARPQPKKAFHRFQQERLSGGIKGHHQHWLWKHFKGPFYAALSNLPPSRYYLNEGRTEPSLLLYELKFEGCVVFISENFSSFFLCVQPPEFNKKEGVDSWWLGKILHEWVRLNQWKPPPPEPPNELPDLLGTVRWGSIDERSLEERYSVPYGSVDEILRPFKVPARLKLGDWFSNSTSSRARHMGNWLTDVTGFVSRHGICLVLFKRDPTGPRMDFPHDFNWLNKGLFKADGKTLVDPPKNRIVNESPDIRDPVGYWRNRFRVN